MSSWMHRTDEARAEAGRYVALATNAHIDRKYTPVGDTVPTIDELESLATRVERLNTEGSTTEFIDAQSEYIDALTVALEWQASRDVTPLTAEIGSLTAQLQAAQHEMHSRELHHFESEELLEAAQATISKALDRLQEPVHPYGDQTIPKVPEIDFMRDAYGDIADDIRVILSRADLSTLAEHDKQVAHAAVLDYVRTKEVAKVQVEFTNQPAFDSAILAAKAQALREAAYDWDETPDRTPRTGADAGDWLRARAASIKQAEAE